MPPIVLSRITPKQILTIENGINSYLYIQSRYNPFDNDFRDVFTDFYLSAQGVMKRPGNRDPYFAEMDVCTGAENLMDIVDRLFVSLAVGKYEFSFATKLLHTKNANSPIYDSKVREYLKTEEHVNFHYYYRNTGSKRAMIAHDWDLLVDWYNRFLPTPRARSWISWFDTTFPRAAHLISDVKKIDFIIFACN